MFQVNARTILELGSELISSDIIAFYELVKNGFDAGSLNVEIRFEIILGVNSYQNLLDQINGTDTHLPELKEICIKKFNTEIKVEIIEEAQKLVLDAKSKREMSMAISKIYGMDTIVISDKGTGMSLNDLEECFLVIGTDSRKKAVDEALAAGAEDVPFLGEKGIGRLSAMRLGDRLRVETARIDDKSFNLLQINWNDFSKPGVRLEDIIVEPVKGSIKPSKDWCGTQLKISGLANDWSRQKLETLVEYDFARLSNPFLDPKKRPKILVFWNDERIGIPWMDRELIQSAHAHVSGRYYIQNNKPILECEVVAADLGFKHPIQKESTTISNFDLVTAFAGKDQVIPDSSLTTLGPFNFEMHWFNRRRLSQVEGIGDQKRVRELQKKWSGILLFRNGFRIFPYGDDEDDWLGLDRKALGRSGYALNKAQFVGFVEITRTKNPRLMDQTNREGLRENPEQQAFLGILEYVIQDTLNNFLKQVEMQFKSPKEKLVDASSQATNLRSKARVALSMLKRVVPKDESILVEELKETIAEFSSLVLMSQARIAEVESEYRQMIELAGVGLMIEVVAHELTRVSQNAMENLNSLSGKNTPSEIDMKISALRSQMKSLGKRLRILDPLSISGRQRKETFYLDQLVNESIEAHEGQFQRHSIQLIMEGTSPPIKVKAVRGMITQVIENLISNSVYWLGVQKNRQPEMPSIITIKIQPDPPSLIFKDNGPGISLENQEKVFLPFFSLKEKSKRRGLGLYIAKENAEYHGGTLELTDEPTSPEGRLNTFLLTLP